MGKKCILLWIICLSAFCTALAQPYPEFTIQTKRHPAPGYYLIGPAGTDVITLIDHAGKSVFPVPATLPVNGSVTDSTMTYFDEGLKAFIRVNSRFQKIDTITLGGTYDVDFHEGHVLSNGNFIILGSEVRVVNMSTLVPGGSSHAQVTGAVIQERTFSGNTVFEWKSLDHIPITDATEDIDLTQTSIDYIHVNSVVRDNDGNFLVSCRHTDEIIKINRSTGSVMWRMGGQKSKGNQFTFTDDTIDGFTGFSHQHDAARTMNGNIIMFDNGNLRPTPFSRIAEYQINESQKTAKLVWSHRSQPDVYAKNMGSVQELSNGNILIGFGSSTGILTAQEVNRDGVVQIELQSPTGMTAYRVRKAIFAMSGSERKVTTPGNVVFADGDSSTHVSLTLTRVDAPTSIIAERHSYAPHNTSFQDAPCLPLAMRWVVRASQPEYLAGSMRFKLTSFGLSVPSLVQLYHRAQEGNEPFTLVATTYDAANQTLIAANFKAGEYLIAYPMCYDPTPSAPSNNEANVSNSVVMRWSEAVQTAGYDVELFKGSSATGTPVRAFRTMRTDTLINVPETGTQYTWRVRAVRPAPAGAGTWSPIFRFRTRLGAPVALSPSSLPDSIAIPQNATFKWTSVRSATHYQLRIVPFGTSIAVLDTVITDTLLKLNRSLPCHLTMMWMARGLVDTSTGDWSNSLTIVTAPCAPTLVRPAVEEQGISPDGTTLEWTSVEGAKSYYVRVYKDVESGTPWFQDTVVGTSVDIEGMKSVTKYYWQVRTVGQYGVGPWSQSNWFMTRGQSVLNRPSLLAPVDVTAVDTLQATLTWASVQEATDYHVQLTSKPTFTKPDVEWLAIRGTSQQCPPLEAGKSYRWRVMALNDVASSPWSDTARFTTMPGPDDALEPLTPISGCLNVPIRGNVTFITDPRFTEYRVEYAVVPLFTTIEQTATVMAGVAPYNLAPEHSYWWRVIGIANGSDVDTGSTASFVTGKDTTTSVNDDAPSASSSFRFSASNDWLILEFVQPSHADGSPYAGMEHLMSPSASLRIVDVAGRTVFTSALGQHVAGNASRSVFDLSQLQSGVYVAVILNEQSKVATHSFVITR